MVKSRKYKFILLIATAFAALLGTTPEKGASRRTATSAKNSSRVVTNKRFIISGSGAPRDTYEDCKREIPELIKTIKLGDMALVEDIKCVPDSQDAQGFVPSFTVLHPENVKVETAFGALFNGRSYCELERLRLVEKIGMKVKVLESSCRSQKTFDFDSESSEMYQPVLVLLMPNEREAAPYESAKALVSAARAAMQRHLQL